MPALLTIIGNSIFFVTIWKTKSMHTPSNTLLGFLSITDLLVGIVCQPLFVVTMLQMPAPCCTDLMLAYNFAFGVTSWNSFLCIGLITADRFSAVFYPYRYRAFATCRKFTYITAIVFGVSISYTTADVILYQKSKIVFLSFLITVNSLVVTSIVVTYILVYRVALRQRKFLTLPQAHRRRLRKKCSTSDGHTKTIPLILVAFIICSLPLISYHIQMLLYYTHGSQFISGLGTWANLLFLSNSAINPLIYFMRRGDIRKAAKRLLCRNFKDSRLNQGVNSDDDIVHYSTQARKVFLLSSAPSTCNGHLPPLSDNDPEFKDI